MQLVRHTIAITKTHHTRHPHFQYPLKHTKFKFTITTVHPSRTLSTQHKIHENEHENEITQIDLDGLPPSSNITIDNNQQSQAPSSSQSNYKPHHGSLPAQVMDSLNALKINVEAETHTVL